MLSLLINLRCLWQQKLKKKTKEKRIVHPGPSRRSSRLHQASSNVEMDGSEDSENIAGTSTMEYGEEVSPVTVDLGDTEAGGILLVTGVTRLIPLLWRYLSLVTTVLQLLRLPAFLVICSSGKASPLI